MISLVQTLLLGKDTWQTVASIATTLSVVFLVIGPRLEIVRRWVGVGLREMTGMTDMKTEVSGVRAEITEVKGLLATEIEDRTRMHTANQRQFRELSAKVTEVAQLEAEVSDKLDAHIKDFTAHNEKTGGTSGTHNA